MTGAVDVHQAIRFVATVRPDVIVLDLLLDPGRPDGIDGPDVLHRLRARGLPVPPVIVVSGWALGADIATTIGAAAYFAKPVDIGALADKIREVTGSAATPAAAGPDGRAEPAP